MESEEGERMAAITDPTEMAQKEAERANERCDELDKELELLRSDIARMKLSIHHIESSSTVYG